MLTFRTVLTFRAVLTFPPPSSLPYTFPPPTSSPFPSRSCLCSERRMWQRPSFFGAVRVGSGCRVFVSDVFVFSFALLSTALGCLLCGAFLWELCLCSVVNWGVADVTVVMSCWPNYMPGYVFKITFTNYLLYQNICATTVRRHFVYAVTTWPPQVIQICKMDAAGVAKTIVIK